MMKTLRYILILLLGMGLFHACLIDDESTLDLNDDGPNLASFEASSLTFAPVASGAEYKYNVKMKVIGPTSMEMDKDITVTIDVDPASTAVAGKHYRLDSKTMTLKAADNFLGLLPITVLTEGNEPPLDPVPVLILKVTNVSGDDRIINNGKALSIKLNYVFFCPFAGPYDVELLYFHPTAGGSYPNEPYGGIRHDEKELAPLSANKVETFFAVWEDNYTYIEIDDDNKVTISFNRSDAKSGDPNDPSKENTYDPETGVIQIYYYYPGSGGNRIFWEKFTPKF